LADTLLADLQSTTTGLRHHHTVTADGNRAVVLDGDPRSVMASRMSTDSLDPEGQVSVRPNKLINSSNYNLYIHCCCWRFGNRCCLRRNDCPPGVAVVDSK